MPPNTEPPRKSACLDLSDVAIVRREPFSPVVAVPKNGQFGEIAGEWSNAARSYALRNSAVPKILLRLSSGTDIEFHAGDVRTHRRVSYLLGKSAVMPVQPGYHRRQSSAYAAPAVALGQARAGERLEDRTLLTGITDDQTAVFGQIEFSTGEPAAPEWKLNIEGRLAERWQDHAFFADLVHSFHEHTNSPLPDQMQETPGEFPDARFQIEGHLSDILAEAEPGKRPAPLQIIFGDGRLANVSLNMAVLDGQKIWRGEFREVTRFDATNAHVLVLADAYQEYEPFEFERSDSWIVTDSEASFSTLEQATGQGFDNRDVVTEYTFSGSGIRLPPVLDLDDVFESSATDVSPDDSSLGGLTSPLPSAAPADPLVPDEAPVTDEAPAATPPDTDAKTDASAPTFARTDLVPDADSSDTANLIAAVTPLATNEDNTQIIEVSFQAWIAEEPSVLTEAASAVIPVASVETEMLLASLDPATVSGSVAAPLEPVLGMASTVVLMVETVGRSLLLALVGEGGPSGPVADFVEPILELADASQTPEHWELKVSDAIETSVAQVVSGDRHFEIRNIGPAADAGGNSSGVIGVALLSLPRHGALEQVGVRPTSFRYVPDPGFSGVDVFRFRMRTSSGATREGQIVINVLPESARSGMRTASRAADVPFANDVQSQTVAAFEGFEDWHHRLD